MIQRQRSCLVKIISVQLLLTYHSTQCVLLDVVACHKLLVEIESRVQSHLASATNLTPTKTHQTPTTFNDDALSSLSLEDEGNTLLALPDELTMSTPAANTRSRNATPNNTPAKARGKGSSSPPTSVGVGTKFSALSLLGPSPEVNDEQQTTQTIASTLRMDIFGLLGANPDAHKDDSSRAEFSSKLAEYTSVGEVASSDPIFTVAREHFGLKQEYKVVLIGGASVGKSAWVEKLKSNRFEVKYDTKNKAKVEVRTLVINTNHGLVKIDVWDITGSDPFDGYFVGAHGAVMMYDVKDEKSPMKALTGMYKSLKRVCEGIPLVLVGNKAEWSSRARTKGQQNNARAVATFHRKKGLKVRARFTSL